MQIDNPKKGQAIQYLKIPSLKHILLSVFLLLIFSPQNSLAKDESSKLGSTIDKGTPWEITAKSLTYKEKEEVYMGEGDVVIRKDDQVLYAQKVIYNMKTGIVKASGGIRLETKGDILTGDRGTFDLDKQTGEVINGCLFLSQNHYYISGSVMQKVGEDSYLIKDCHLTTCDGKNKPWSITGSEVKVTIEGYGKVKHAAFRVRDFPILYAPYMIFPAKTKRQTGLLQPQIGYSDRKGFIYNQPFFWAINENTDATFYVDYMSERGIKGGLEYRYILDDQSKGTLMYDFLNDRQVDDGTQNSSEWGYEEDNYNRPNSDRYWFRMKNDQKLPFGFNMKADLDIVSDQDYLHEFRYGYNGYYETDRYFENIFGRGLDDYDDSTRVNNLNLTKSWSQFTLYGETRWYDNVISRRQAETYSPLLYLPLITFTGSKQEIFNTPFYFDLNSEYKYSYKRLSTKTQRANVYPTIYLPLNLKSYFSFETSFGVQETIWNIDKYESSSGEGTYNRELFYFKQDLQTDIYNVFDTKWKRIDRIKHLINPRIVYDYRPEEKVKEVYPEGRAGQTNILTYSITNIFTSRSIKPSEEKDSLKADEEDKQLNYTYNEFCRFKVQQSYNIKESREDKEDKEDKEPFSPIYGEIKVSPLKYFYIQADAEWNCYESAWDSHNVKLSIWDNRRDRLSVEHRYERDSKQSIYSYLLLNITDKISIYTDYERNLYDNQDIQQGIGVIYKAQCWGLNFFYLDDVDEETFGVSISLYGLGEIGRQLMRGKYEE